MTAIKQKAAYTVHTRVSEIALNDQRLWMETVMLNHMTVMRAAVPLNQMISVDPLAIRRSDYDRPAQISTRTADNDCDAQHTERDPFSLASPFCNPDF